MDSYGSKRHKHENTRTHMMTPQAAMLGKVNVNWRTTQEEVKKHNEEKEEEEEEEEEEEDKNRLTVTLTSPDGKNRFGLKGRGSGRTLLGSRCRALHPRSTLRPRSGPDRGQDYRRDMLLYSAHWGLDHPSPIVGLTGF
ncbi:hypothetical protein EYF80_001090 [Liparis tanakae]|uniref:Uncharacterized protein n=1 Tax=Liparis tanakae TaxID=230148 RepID=A0A4Z2JGH1_9TELE|nr:hypothetical protein EYF80_001090 [Liparis tanakae]